MPTCFVVVNLLQIIFAEVAPVIIGGYVCRNGQRSLLFVKQYLEDDVFVGKVLAIEHKLDVRGHRKHQTSPPAMILKGSKVFRLEIETVDSQQAHQRQNDGFMAKAQRSAMNVPTHETIGFVDHLTQQMALGEGLLASVEQ